MFFVAEPERSTRRGPTIDEVVLGEFLLLLLLDHIMLIFGELAFKLNRAI